MTGSLWDRLHHHARRWCGSCGQPFIATDRTVDVDGQLRHDTPACSGETPDDRWYRLHDGWVDGEP